MKILIAAPLRQEADIFEAYQDSLDRLILPEGVTADRFYVVNDCEEIIPHIRDAKYIRHDTGEEYRKTEDVHLWTARNMERMSDLRNICCRMVLAGGYDAWLSADTDLVLNPHTLEWLIAADKDIVSEIFWTRNADGGLWCNAWMSDQYNLEGHGRDWMEPGLYQVGMTGALMLVKRRVFEVGVGYARIPNILDALRGEDRHFCIRAACAGFDIWMDTHAPAVHLYTRKVFEEWQKRQNDRTAQKAL